MTDAAAQLGVTRAALSRLLNGRAGISPEMSLRLERWLGVEHGGSASVWLGMQAAYDPESTRRREPQTTQSYSVHPQALLIVSRLS